MEWVALIGVLLEVFGPAIKKWMESCLEEKLQEAALALPPVASYACEADATDALFDEAIRNLPFWAINRKRALAAMKAAAREPDGKVRRRALDAAELSQARAFGVACRGE